MSDGGKGSKQRPGKGYDTGWDAIFGKKKEQEKPETTFPFVFTSGQHVIFKLDDPTIIDLDYLRDYIVHECFIEKRPNGKIWITLKGVPGTYEQKHFEDFEEWASHQRRVVE